ncbi:MAG: hypothetical protein JWN76_641 [Chitinophagaceae bacterium]|nr:hypothetical protein [Chitinophagaceae bacterium]
MERNEIIKSRLNTLGYNFVNKKYLQPGEDEYYLRDMQNKSGIDYRQLVAYEIEVLVRNGNTSDNWNNILVSDAFNPELVKNCKFYGLVRIGKLEPYCLGFSDLQVPVGLYNSTIISCDFGDNVVIQNCNYISHYIIGNEVIIVNVNELVTTDHAKFGNGILKEDEDESVRVWLELCNENGGRRVIPFNGMLPGDAYLWSKYRDDETLLNRFIEFTEKKFNKKRGYYGKIGDRTVIKNCKIIKDVWIGSDAYLKGANKLKNLTINSDPEEGATQIGEGCELVNGIIGFGCRIFYGVKAVRFIMASHSQLKYGARLINSFLGSNATISCCEVLNSLIFPTHEQHHNNSFLCAAVVMGQSNIAAGATIGSNHNSRSPDGEIVAGRGFWPGLCVSLKHNSKFASFTILAKGDYPAELNISIPFSLVSNDVSKDELIIMPGYWFMYNMYALARNAWKYVDRDKRTDKTQLLEYDYLAPDSINEMFDSLRIMELYTGKAYLLQQHGKKTFSEDDMISSGKHLLKTKDPLVAQLEIVADCFENTSRKTKIIKVLQAYGLFEELISYYGTLQLVKLLEKENISNINELGNELKTSGERKLWLNIGGQLLLKDDVDLLKDKVKNDFNDWDDVHEYYRTKGAEYEAEKIKHGLASLMEIHNVDAGGFNESKIEMLFSNAAGTKTWMAKGIYASREKDYSNEFRKMVYDTSREMNQVLGKIEENSFINDQHRELDAFKDKISQLKQKLLRKKSLA